MIPDGRRPAADSGAPEDQPLKVAAATLLEVGAERSSPFYETRAASLLLLNWMASDNSATDQPLVRARLPARQRAPLQIRDARVPIALPPHPRDHADVDHRFGGMEEPAQHLAHLRSDVLRQRGQDDVVVVEPSDLNCARTATPSANTPLHRPSARPRTARSTALLNSRRAIKPSLQPCPRSAA